jgi:hypothetical protein
MTAKDGMQPNLVHEISETVCASLAQAQAFAAPFTYFRAKNLFPRPVYAGLRDLPFAPPVAAAGRRECVSNRLYFDQPALAGNVVIHAVATAFQAPRVAAAWSKLCGGAELDGTYLRLEYALDSDGFWLEPHTDLGVKKFTGLIALSCAEEDGDLGTDLYRSPDEHVTRTPFVSNAGTFFVPGSATWHGFAKRPMKGLRKSLIVNYVGPEWRSRDQLAFPDRPISLIPSEN